MGIRYFQSIWKRQVLLILTVFFGKSNALNVSELTPSCLFYFPFETNIIAYDLMKPPNGFCKSVATYSSFSQLHPPRADLNVTAFKGKLSYVFIYDQYLYYDLRIKIQPTNLPSYAKELNDHISEYKIDVFVFDFFIDNYEEELEPDDHFQDDLVSLCNKIRETQKHIVFGLKLHRTPEVVTPVIKVEKVDKVFCLYIISTYGYEPCEYMNDEEDMAKPPSIDQMQYTVKKYKDFGYDVKKMFITVNIRVISFKNEFDKVPDFWSYTWMCQADPGDRRRYCRGSLESIYDQSKIVFDNELAGVFVEAIDCDDYKDNCGCKPWPASQCVCDGIHGRKINDKLKKCKNFGLLPKERH